MARRRRSRSYYFTRSRRRGGGRGRSSYMKHLLRVAAGFGDAYVNPMIPINGVPSTAIGMFGKDDVLTGIGEWQIGASLAAMIGNPMGGQTGVWL